MKLNPRTYCYGKRLGRPIKDYFSRPMQTGGAWRRARQVNPLTVLRNNTRVWHDNQDLSTMFADYVGTPASVGTAVALQWDKAKHGFGSESKASAFLFLNGSATAATYNTSTGVGTASRVDASNQSSVRLAVTTGRPYSVDLENTGADSVLVRDGAATNTIIATIPAGQRKTVFVPPASTTVISLTALTNGATASFTVHSVKEVLGTPRYQSTAAQRPILGRHPKGGRRNLLVRSREFDNASWSKADTTITANASNGVGGTATMDLCTEGSAGSAQTYQAATITANATYTFAIDLKRGNHDWVMLAILEPSTGNVVYGWFNLATGVVGSTSNAGTASGAAIAIRNLGNGIYRCILTGAVNNSATTIRAQARSAAADSSLTTVNNATRYQDRAQLESGAVETAFQDVTTQYDVTETGVPDVYYLQADGSDDGMVTPSLNLSGTNKIGVFTAVRKLSDAAAGVLVELSTSVVTNNGSFRFAIPDSAATNFNWASRGTTQSSASYTDASVAAPKTAVLTGIGDIAGPSAVQRLNGVQVASSSSSQGSGNYGNYPLYFFRRGGTTTPFNGLEYGFALCDTTPTAGQIDAMETYQNNIVGAY